MLFLFSLFYLFNIFIYLGTREGLFLTCLEDTDLLDLLCLSRARPWC